MAKSRTPAERLDEMVPFLRTIAEEPEADLPRLVFADWLDEHDDPDRAKFIRLQIELARMDPFYFGTNFQSNLAFALERL